MKPLETNQRVLMWLYAFPPDNSDGKWRKIAYFTFTICVIAVHAMSVAASSTFIYRNISISLEETLFSLFHNFSASGMLYQSIVTVILRHNLNAIFKGLSTIYDQSELKNQRKIVRKKNLFQTNFIAEN